MQIRNSWRRALVVPMALIVLGVIGVPTTARADAVERLQRFLETTKTLRVDFAQTVTARNGKRPQQSSGVMLISRPGKFRWQLDRPYHQLIVGDGERVWMYDPDLRQATVRKLDAALGSTPAALLVGGNSLERNFELRDLGVRDGLEWLEALPKARESGFERLQLGFEGDNLKAMELLDNFGQTTSLVFANPQRNVALPEAQFRFVPPAGTDILGE